MKKLLFITCIVFISFNCNLPYSFCETTTRTEINTTINKLKEKINSTESNQKIIDHKISELTSKIKETREIVQNSKEQVTTIKTYLVSLVIILIGFFIGIYKYTQMKVEAITEKFVKNIIGEFVEDLHTKFNKNLTSFQEKSDNLLKKIEDDYIKYIQIVSLKVAKEYSQALDEASWNGDFKTFKNKPHSFQRILIACLTKHNEPSLNDNRQKAWQWIKSLIDESPDFNNIYSMIRVGITLKQFEETVDLYDKYKRGLNETEKDHCEPLLFVAIRRSRKPENDLKYSKRLKQIAEKYHNTNDIILTTNIAAFYRDEGEFDRAYNLMVHNVRRLTGVYPHQRGWENLFNTYIANCIDLGKPEDAFDQANMLIGLSKRPDNVFTCARLAWLLDDKFRTNKDKILKKIERVIDSGELPEKDDGSIKARSLFFEVKNRHAEAEEVLEKAISQLQEEKTSLQDLNLYYYNCMLAEILVERKSNKDINKAIKILSDIAPNDQIGAAQYILSKAYCLNKEHDKMMISLEEATKIKKKWLNAAKNDSIMKNHNITTKLLEKYAV